MKDSLPDFKRLFEVSPSPQLVLDRKLIIIAASDAYLRAVSRRREEVVGLDFAEAFRERYPFLSGTADADRSSLEPLLESFRRILATGAAEQLPTGPHPLYGGHWRLSSLPIFPGEGSDTSRVSCILHRAEDVTESVEDSLTRNRSVEALQRSYQELELNILQRSEELSRNNEELRESQNKYSELVNTIEGIVWESKVGASPYTFVSRQAEKLLGYPVERWLSEPGFWQRIVHPEDLQRLTGERFVEPNEKNGIQREYRVIAADSRVLWIRDVVSVIFEGGRPSKFRGLMMDCTERKRAEQQMVAARESALRAARVKADFLANMSHEIRTPLNAVIGMSSLMLDTPLSASQRDGISTIKRSADTLLTLINDILDFSKIEAGKLKLEILDFDLAQLASDTIDMIRVEASRKGLKVDTQIAPDVPRRLRGDPGRLLQIWINLLGNAIKFTAKGSVLLSVGPAPGAGGLGTTLRFEVRDTGLGIPAPLQKQLFTPFTQGDSSTARKFGGSGLGLSICKRLVELMKGRIGVESAEGQGAVFWFEIPFEKASEKPVSVLAPAQASAPRQAAAGSGAGLRILVAEDNAANQKVLLLLLEKLGYRADAVGNGNEALDASASGAYDLILMDCQMPEMDGYEASRRIRERELRRGTRRVPIIALTAHALGGDKEKCIEAGMDDYLSKPIDFALIERTLGEFGRGRPAGPPPESPAPAFPVIDFEHLRALGGLQQPGKPDLIAELVGIFKTSSREKLTAIRQALGQSELGKVAKESHGLKSTCFTVGARAMAAACGDLERAAGHGEPVSECRELLSLAESEYDLAQEELGRVMARGTG